MTAVWFVAAFLLCTAVNSQDCTTQTKCKTCTDDANCNWCYLGNANTLGYCTAKDKCGDGSQIGTFKTLLLNGFDLKSVIKGQACPIPTDEKDSSLVLDKKNCVDCLRNKEDHRWCEIDMGTARGGVCLDSKKKSTDCKGLQALMNGATGSHAFQEGLCPPDGVCEAAGTSCTKCKAIECVWCGLTLKEKTGGAFVDNGGTHLGLCMPPAATQGHDACAGVKSKQFGEMKKVLEYTKGTHEYVSELVEFAANGKGWGTDACKATYVVDPMAATVADCAACVKENAKWCEVVILSDKKEPLEKGGVCLGKADDIASKTCGTLAREPSAAFHNTTATKQDKCSGAKPGRALASAVVIAAVMSWFA